MKLESFTESPKCPKCLTMSPMLKLIELSDGKECLEVTCEECGYSWNMETADSEKKKEIMEVKKEQEVKEDDETKEAPVEKV